jgi:ABC-type antimicrobial peptide transport system permease subunit
VDADARWLTIVGVADDIKEFRLDEQTRPMLYVTYRQFPTSFMYLTVRTATEPAALAGTVQRSIAAIDRDQPVYDIRTMDDAIAAAVPRFHVALLVVFAAVALLLSAIGVYGVMSYLVGQRTQEIGIRMALGASGRQVMVAMMREVAALGLLGIAAGLVSAAGLTRLLSGMLFGVAPTDARAFAGAAALLLAVAMAACGIPAMRATRVDPTVALRHE